MKIEVHYPWSPWEPLWVQNIPLYGQVRLLIYVMFKLKDSISRTSILFAIFHIADTFPVSHKIPIHKREISVRSGRCRAATWCAAMDTFDGFHHVQTSDILHCLDKLWQVLVAFFPLREQTISGALLGCKQVFLELGY